VLAIQGEDDPYGSPAQVEAIVKRSAGRTDALMLPECGHSPHFDRSEATFQAMKDFIFSVKV
jgi:pimeloyl-ACP methyl ester carboxylesterase